MAVSEDMYEGQRQSIKVDQSHPTRSLPRLTSQEQMFVAAMNAGASVAEASRRCGITYSMGQKWKNREEIIAARDHYDEEFRRDILPHVQFNKDDAHHMYMEAYRGSANATEMVKAMDSLVKLHRLNEPEKAAEEKEINTLKQLEKQSVAALLKLAGYDASMLSPDDIAEGDFTDVES